MVLQAGIKRRKFLEYVDAMNCIRKMNSYTTSFTYSLAMALFWKKIGTSNICKQTIKWGKEKQDIHVTC